MHIAILGGKARSLVNFRGHLIADLVQRGHHVTALAPDEDQEVRQRLENLGADYVQVPMQRTGHNPLADLQSLITLTRIFSHLKPDLYLGYTIKPVIYGTLAAWLARVPRRFALITGRGSALMAEEPGIKARCLGRIVQTLYGSALRRCHGVLFQNGDDRDLFIQTGMLPETCPRTVVNGSGIDLTSFSPTPFGPGPVVFLYVGRLIRDKGIREYLEAARLLSESGIPCECQVLGGLDPNPSSLTPEELQRWQQSGAINYLGETQDVRPFMRNAHVIVLPSYAEGTPRAVLEAMALGRAIITTDAPGCRETVTEGVNGHLVPIKDARALAEAMARLAVNLDRIREFGQESRRVAEVKFDVRRVNDSLISFLTSHLRPNIPGNKQ